MMPNNDELVRAIQRLIDQQAADRTDAEKAEHEDRRRLIANEKLLVKTRQEFDGYKKEVNERLDRKAARIRWLAIGLLFVSVLFVIMVLISFR